MLRSFQTIQRRHSHFHIRLQKHIAGLDDQSSILCTPRRPWGTFRTSAADGSAILADANPGVHKSALATTPSRSIENCVRFKSRTELLALFLNFNIFPDLRYPASSIDVQR
jgi:hypothetical protein